MIRINLILIIHNDITFYHAKREIHNGHHTALHTNAYTTLAIT